MSRRTILLVGIALMVAGMAMGQNPRQQYIDLRPDLAKKKFTEGKHLIKTLPDGRKVSLGFKAGEVVEIFLTDKKGKERKGVLAEGKVSHDGVLPPEAQRTPRNKQIDLFFTPPDGCRVCTLKQFFDIGGDVVIVIVTCCD